MTGWHGSRVAFATPDDLRAIGIDPEGRTRRPVSGVWDEWHLPPDPFPEVVERGPWPTLPDTGHADTGEGVTTADAATLAGVSISTLARWRTHPPSPAFPEPTTGVRDGRPVYLYDPDEIQQWLTERETNR